MPRRLTPLINDQYYHIFNRGINKQTIFLGVRDYSRAAEILEFYSYAAPTKLSKFLLLSREQRQVIWKKMRNENKKIVNIICYCFMPNHFHFLLEQKVDNGISKFMSNFQNSYTRYFNTKRKGIGPLLQGQFKAVRIEDDNQLLHLTRYIHLNPYSSFIVKELIDILHFPWSSLREYLKEVNTTICNKDIILSNFANTTEYKSFIFDQAGYQKKLNQIKHLSMEI